MIELNEQMANGLDEYEDGAFEEDAEAEADIFRDLFVEAATSLIYEVQMFDSFCLVRPASPNMYGGIKKLNHVDFVREFTPYEGDHETIRAMLKTGVIDFIVG